MSFAVCYGILWESELTKKQKQLCLGLTYIMQLLKTYDSFSHLELHCTDICAHTCACTCTTLTLAQGSWHERSLSKEQRINTRETLLSSANTDIVMAEMASEVEGFPPGIVYFVNEWVAHNGVADKLKRYKDKSFRRNKKWLTGTHQQMVNHFRLWGWAVTHEIVFQKGWKGDGEEREKERARARGGARGNHKRVDWLREGCLILDPIVIGWEVWPHLKTGLLQFSDIEISLCVCMCWRGWHYIHNKNMPFK